MAEEKGGKVTEKAAKRKSASAMLMRIGPEENGKYLCVDADAAVAYLVPEEDAPAMLNKLVEVSLDNSEEVYAWGVEVHAVSPTPAEFEKNFRLALLRNGLFRPEHLNDRLKMRNATQGAFPYTLNKS